MSLLTLRVAGLLPLTALLLPSCTPPQSSAPTTEWVVANQTLDTLWVSVRYPRDSSAITSEQLTYSRRQLMADSLALTRQNGFYQPPWLQRFTQHQGQWYLVQNTWINIVYYADFDPSPAQAPRVDRTRGLVTYRVPPLSTQQLFETPTTPAFGQAELPLVALQLQQRQARRAVLPGPPLLQVFRPQSTGHEQDYAPHYRCQLTVGLGLTLQR